MNDDNWLMGSLAAQDQYRPLGNDPWTNTMPNRRADQKAVDDYYTARMEQSIMPDRGIPYGAMTPQEENIALPERDQAPQSPFDLGLMAGGPLAIVGGAMTTATPAEAARLKMPVKMGGIIRPGIEVPTLGKTSSAFPAPTLFDYSHLNDVPNVSQFDLPRYEPPRGVSARVQDLVKNEDVADKMLKMMQRGREIGGDTFYGTEPLRDAFMQELGRDKGQQGFARYMDFASGASPRSKVPENARNASYYYVLDAQGKPMPAIGDANPQPYGHLAQRLHQQNANTIVDGGWDLFKNPKPPSFSQNLQGNLRPVTVDAHAFKAPAMLSEDPRFLLGSFKPGKDLPTINPSKMFESGKLSMEDALKEPTYWAARPNDNEYLAMEDYYKRLSREAGFPEPGVAQAAGWSGGGEMTGLGSPAGDPFIRAVENRANITAEQRGISPAEALSRMMRGKEALLGFGGAAAVAPGVMGGLASQDEYQSAF